MKTAKHRRLTPLGLFPNVETKMARSIIFLIMLFYTIW